MKTLKGFFAIALLGGLLLSSLTGFNVEIARAEQVDLTEKAIESYLKKNALGDTGNCLVDSMKLDIMGISDVIPGQQVEVFYRFEYSLRCNTSTKKKDGRGILRAARLRNGNWIDRDNFEVIPK